MQLQHVLSSLPLCSVHSRLNTPSFCVGVNSVLGHEQFSPIWMSCAAAAVVCGVEVVVVSAGS